MRGWLNARDLRKPDWLRFRSSSVTITTTIIGGITTIITIITTIIITRTQKEKGTSGRMSLFSCLQC
jgi:hypothetical protein